MSLKVTTEPSAVLITGGSRGIGRAVAVQFAGVKDRTIIIQYLENDQAARETAHAVEQSGSCCHLVRANLMFPDEIDGLFNSLTPDFPHITSFIHCAALTSFKPLLATKPNQWDLTMNVSTRAFVQCAQRAASCMPAGGSIVAISSLGSRRVLPNYGAMGCAKAALETAVRYLATELGPRGIRVNAVSSGFVETDSIKRFPDISQHLQESVRHTPLGRLATTGDIAGIVAFLCSPSSASICGQTIVADGGLSLR